MSTWVSPAGSIGSYTKQRPFTFDFEAVSSLDGPVVFQLATGSSFPDTTFELITLNPGSGRYIGRLTAVPNYIDINKTFNFSLSAAELVAGQALANIREFSVTITNTDWVTPTGSIGIFIEQLPLSYYFQAEPSQPSNTIVYKLLNGQLPTGENMTLTSSGHLSGVPAQVASNTTFIFTIRAYEYSGAELISFRDRTFDIIISGSTAPQFTTLAGNILTLNDSTWQPFQLGYSNPDPGNAITISLVSGKLPPGLEINSLGLIRGYANPPVDQYGSPMVHTYEFTLQITSVSGSNLSTYSITVINQETLPGFSGRSPVIFNTRPPRFKAASNDPYIPYYLESTNLGIYQQDNYFIFKFIGYDFDGDELTYDIQGLEYIVPPGSTVPTIVYDQNTGWVSGTLPIIGASVSTYNFTVRVYKTNNPLKTSDTFRMSITLVGERNIIIDWDTEGDLGIIDNGAISTKTVKATNRGGLPLKYRIIGSQFSYNLKTVVNIGTGFRSFGDVGANIIGSSDGLSWDILDTTSLLNSELRSAVYDSTSITPWLVGVGVNTIGGPVIVTSSDGYGWTPMATLSDKPLNSVTYNNGSVFIAVGKDGTILRYNSVTDTEWIVKNSGTTANLNQVIWDGTRFIAVGDQGTILYSSNLGETWTPSAVGINNNIRAIIKTNARYIAIGDLGLLIYSTDGVVWTTKILFEQYSYNKILYSTVGLESVTIILGTDGIILRSVNDGINWTTEVSGTTNDLYDICFDVINGTGYYVVGDAGTIIASLDGIDWSSPTIGKLPPNLIFTDEGDIVGRLAFESAESGLIEFGTTRIYDFTVQAFNPEFNSIKSSKNFTLTTYQRFKFPYDNLYIKALVSHSDREKISALLNNDQSGPEDPDAVIKNEYLYRQEDPYFGKAKSVNYQHLFGVPSQATNQFYSSYIAAVSKNHYRRSITLGPIKTAVARNSTGAIVYEVVYSEIVDNLIDQKSTSINKQIIWPRPINLRLDSWFTANDDLPGSLYYFDNTPVVKKVSADVLESTVIPLNSIEGIEIDDIVTAGPGAIIIADSAVVSIGPNSVELNVPQTLNKGDQILFNQATFTSLTPGEVRTLYPNSLPNMREQIDEVLGNVNDDSVLPLWMSGQQINGSSLGYTPAWVICYTKPGYSNTVKNDILANWPFKLNQIDFQLDRFEVDRSITYDYLGSLSSVPLWASIPSAQPAVVDNSKDSYIYFSQKTILPGKAQE